MIIDFWWSLLKEPDIYIHVLCRYIYGALYILHLETYLANYYLKVLSSEIQAGRKKAQKIDTE